MSLDIGGTSADVALILDGKPQYGVGELAQVLGRGGEVNAVAAAIVVTPRGFNGYEPAAFFAGAGEDAARDSVAAMVAFNRPNAKTHSGIWRDIAVRKRQIEVDAQILPIAEIGAAHGVPCPIVRRLMTLIHEIEQGRRVQADANLLVLMNG